MRSSARRGHRHRHQPGLPAVRLRSLHARPTARPPAATAGSASAWRSSATSSSCTAAPCARCSDGENRGTTFTATLPMRVGGRGGAPGDIRAGARIATCRSRLPNLDGIRILVVDDEPDSRGFLSALLQEQGATSGRPGPPARRSTAFAAGAARRPRQRHRDAGQDGYDLIRLVRDLAPHDGGLTPAVALDRLRPRRGCRGRTRRPATSVTSGSRSSSRS